MTYHPSEDDALSHQSLHVVSLRRSTLVADVVVQDYDYAKPGLAIVGTAPVSSEALAHVSVYGDRVFTQEAAQRVARLRGEAFQAREVLLAARGTQRHLRTGYTFEVGNHPRAEVDKAWLAIQVEHIGRQIHGATELDAVVHDERPEVYRASVTAIPKDVQYREPRRTPWPKIHGFENGVVDGPTSSTYAQIDEQGRYAVKIRFDEGPLNNGKASTWLRMAQPHGGGVEGFHFPLRKDTEVLVEFLDGDPDRPVIGAVLPNAAKPSPVTSGNNTKNVLQTGGSTRLEIEDLGGGQYMHTTTPVQNTSFYMGTDASSKGGHNAELTSGGSAGKSFGSYFDRFVGATKADHVVGDVTRNYDANYATTVAGNVQQTYSANQSTAVIKNVTRDVTGTLSETVTAKVDKAYDATWSLTVTSDVTETFQANFGFSVGGTQDVHVLSKGDATHQAGLFETVNAAASKHTATSGYKLEAVPDAKMHVKANVSIRADVEATLSAPKTTVDGDTSVDVDAGATIEAKAQSVSVVGQSSLRLTSGAKIEITGGDITVSGGTIKLTAGGTMSVAAKGQCVAAAAGAMTVKGGPSVVVKGDVIQLNLGGASPSGLGPQVDALIALDPTLANKLAELQKAGWVIRYGPPGQGSYFDKAKKILVLDGHLATDPQAAFNELGRLTNAIDNPPRPLFGQQDPMSCGMGSSRMVIDTMTGRDIPEGDLQTQSSAMGPHGYDPVNGTYLDTMDDLLRQNGVSGAAEPRNLDVDGLADHTKNGEPAIVQVDHYDANGNRTGGHFVVVDSVTTNPDGSRTLNIRDPWPPGQGTSRQVPEDQFLNNYYNDQDPNGGRTRYIGWALTTDGSGNTGP